ncbi:hypothetical protein [Agrobacterium vitis]|uniref:hypothetical protein n=1 Tax=Agrobacterium vitis TaxID=373 RepID=UPI001F457A0A|nr:hypothetical protein [Agrobacterium vitis]
MAPDRRIVPQLAIGTGNAFLIQRSGNRPRPDPGGKVAEDASNHLGLSFIDLPVAANEFALAIQLLHDPVTVAQTAT